MYFCPKFLDIFLVFYRYLEYALVRILLNIGICRQINPRTGGGLSQPRTGGGGVDFSPPLRS